MVWFSDRSIIIKKGDIVKTRCCGCRCLIDFGNTYCDKCKSVVIKRNRSKNKEIEATTKSGRWKAVRLTILRRDKCCVLCFKRHGVYNLKNLQVHHIEKRVDRPDLIYEPTNLVTLCRDCHEEVELLSPHQQIELLGGKIPEIDYYPL